MQLGALTLILQRVAENAVLTQLQDDGLLEEGSAEYSEVVRLASEGRFNEIGQLDWFLK